MLTLLVLGFTRHGVMRAGQKCNAFALMDIAVDLHELASVLWQSVNLVVSLQWGHSSLADPDL